jgi:DNA repair protein RadC
MSITDWDVHDRPREKLLSQGASALTDAELLAIFLRMGVHGKSAVDLAQELIHHFGSLSRLFGATQDELTHIKGMGSAKFAQLQAVFEMSRRALADNATQHAVIADIAALKTLIQLHLHDIAFERCIALFLDPSLRLMHIETLTEGTLTNALLDVRYIAQRALQHNAHAVILAHNHPQGTSEPSNTDIRTTIALQQQLLPLGVHLLDHFIVANGQTPYSMAENQLITSAF